MDVAAGGLSEEQAADREAGAALVEATSPLLAVDEIIRAVFQPLR